MIKKFLIGVVLLGSVFAFTPNALSQTIQHQKGHGPEQEKEKDFTKLTTDLSLTDEQVASWKALDAQFKTKREELRKNNSLTEEDKRTQMKSWRVSKDSELKKILTEEQYSKFSNGRPSKGEK